MGFDAQVDGSDETASAGAAGLRRGRVRGSARRSRARRFRRLGDEAPYTTGAILDVSGGR
jgi:hypothetical protein